MEKAYITKTDIQHRFGVGINKAGEIMRDIRKACNGGKLGAGRFFLRSLSIGKAW